jgi:hypothetical protein
MAEERALHDKRRDLMSKRRDLMRDGHMPDSPEMLAVKEEEGKLHDQIEQMRARHRQLHEEEMGRTDPERKKRMEEFQQRMNSMRTGADKAHP